MLYMECVSINLDIYDKIGHPRVRCATMCIHRRPGGGDTSRSGLAARAPEGVASSRVAHASAFMLPIHRARVKVGVGETWAAAEKAAA
jgi:hypothetical protein